MKNPFLKAAKLFGSSEPPMIRSARKWKPVARDDRPEPQDFPILLWRLGSAEGWEIWKSPENGLQPLEPPFVWYSLPKG